MVAQHGGVQCEGERRQEDACSKQPCPVDCVWFEWEFWHTCTKTCGGGKRMRIREKRTENVHGGKICPGHRKDEQACAQWQCPVNCKWSEWTPWTQCSKSCGGGRRSRDRAVDIPGQHGGIQCRGDTEVWEWCRTNPCAADYHASIPKPPGAAAGGEGGEGGDKSAVQETVQNVDKAVAKITGTKEDKSGNRGLMVAD